MNKLCCSFPESHSEYYCTYFMRCAFLCYSRNNFKSAKIVINFLGFKHPVKMSLTSQRELQKIFELFFQVP